MNRQTLSQRMAVIAGVVGLAIAGAFVLGADPSAQYPLGDGGFFLAIIRQIVDANLGWLQTVSFNDTTIPFAYSPLAFYCIAFVVKLTSLSIPQAMNLWVIAWDLLIGPAAYVAARRFLATRSEAFVAAAFLIVFTPGDLPWLGQGGGATRAPAYVFFLLGSGAIWDAFGTANLRSAVAAGVCAAAAAWMHMEYAFLLAATFIVLACFRRPKVATVLTIVATSLVCVLPWAILVRSHYSAFVTALHTSRMTSYATAFEAYFGMIQLEWWIGLWGFLAALAACFWRQYLYLVWVAALLFVDSRAGPLAAHLPSALAMGWAFGRTREWLEPIGKLSVAVLLTAVLFESALLTARSNTNEFARLQPADIANMASIARSTEPNAWVTAVYPGGVNHAFYTDLTYDWLPALTGRRSPLIYAGLEWVDAAAFTRKYNDFAHVGSECTLEGSDCVVAFTNATVPNRDPAYAYVPAHGDAYPIIVAQLGGDKRFVRVFGNAAGTLFRIRR